MPRPPTPSLIRSSTIYTAGALLNKALGFFLIPLYTRCLPVAEYGALSLLNLGLQLLGFVFLFGVSSAAMRDYYEPGADDKHRREVYGTALLILLAGPALFVGALLAFGRPLAPLIFPSIPPGLVGLVVLIALFTPVIALFNGLLRVQDRALTFVLFNLAFFVLQTSAIVMLVAGFERGLTGQLEARVGMYAVFGLVATVWMFRHTGLRFSRTAARRLLVFGLPLVPFFIFAWVNNSAGRFVLKRVGSLHDVGLFALAAQFAGIVMLFANAAYQAILPHFYRVAGEPGAARSLGALTTRYIAAFAVLTLLVAVAAEPVILLVARSNYHDAVRYVPLLAIAAWLAAVARLGNAYLTYAKQTGRLSAIHGVGMVFGLIVLAAFLFGAGWTTGGVVATTVVLNGALLFLMASRALNALPTDIETRPLATIAAITFGATAMLHLLARPEWNWILLAIKSIAVLACGYAIIRVGRLRVGELFRRPARAG